MNATERCYRLIRPVDLMGPLFILISVCVKNNWEWSAMVRYNVRDYGAVGDRSTDETSAIQNFLSQCKDEMVERYTFHKVNTSFQNVSGTVGGYDAFR
ncbi:hypothetical protein CHM34_06420 [Paludifilum halophilum]|uniref:Pectate lyase superfamily protein domain-containing protein n=1 Tax=Paludifilum halophilum TaxID=1642702 RepID=A0A235B8Y3_9BACL|nr:hypothetical protein CHM34_06420 [Paludifilum halophilum]